MPSKAASLLFRLRARALVGATFGGWRLDSFLGSGAFGATFSAHAATGERAVLKLARPGAVPDDGEPDPPFAHGAAWTECAALQACEDCASVPCWLGVVNERGRYFIALERMPGESLALLLAEGRVFSDAEIGFVARDLAATLACAHAHGVAHNDVRPANVLFNPADGEGPGRPRTSLVDFGLATFFPPEASVGDFAASSAIDRSGLADVLLFLLYSRYDGARSQAGWEEELDLPDRQAACLRELFSPDPAFSGWDGLVARVADAFPAAD